MFLAQLVDVFHALELWRVDPVLQGELCLKLASLYEAKATLKIPFRQLKGFVLLYDRKLLLECLAQLERDVNCVEVARECVEEGGNLGTLHTQFLMAITRVKVKLASTIPPPCKWVNILVGCCGGFKLLRFSVFGMCFQGWKCVGQP